MKKFKKFFALVAVAILGLFTLASCGSSAGKIQKAFEGQGYTFTVDKISEEASAIKGIYKGKKGENKLAPVVYFMELGAINSENLEKAAEELEANKDLASIAKAFKEIIKNHKEDIEAAITELENTGLVNDNCILLFYTDMNARTTFKEA